MSNFNKFWNDDSGAVTVDWVVLTGIVVVFGAVSISLILPINNSVESIGNTISANS